MVNSFNILVVVISILGLFVMLEFLRSKYKVTTEITRKIAHVASGLCAIGYSYWLSNMEFFVVLLIFISFFLFNAKFQLVPSITDVSRRSIGDVLFPVGLLVLSYYLYDDKLLFSIGVAVLAVPDTIVGLYGYYFYKSKANLLRVLMYISVCTLLLINTPLAGVHFLFLAILLSITEMISPFGTDNLTVPAIYTSYILLFF